MQYDNKYDIDHNDCPEYETDVPQEFANDFVVETDSETANEFTTTPDEFTTDEYDSGEQAATTDLSELYAGGDGIDNAPTDCDDNAAETAEDNYGVTENGDDCGCGCGCNTENATDEYEYSPSDEQAATLDDCYCGDTCGCDTYAQEKCRLDDYEIISDVLSSEKEIVKLYSTALCETAEENLRDVIRENFTEAAADQYKAFSYMRENGMYQTEQASENKLIQAKQQFTPLCDNCK